MSCHGPWVGVCWGSGWACRLRWVQDCDRYCENQIRESVCTYPSQLRGLRRHGRERRLLRLRNVHGGNVDVAIYRVARRREESGERERRRKSGQEGTQQTQRIGHKDSTEHGQKAMD